MGSSKTLKFILKALILCFPVTMESVVRCPVLLPSSMQLATQDSPRLSREHVEVLVGEFSQITKTLICIHQHKYFIIFKTLTIKTCLHGISGLGLLRSYIGRCT